MLAHRGLVTEELREKGVWENTASAFCAAQEHGADIIESDCRSTRDGHVVLIHDPDLRRLTGEDRTVAGSSLDELRRVFASHGDLLTVREALDLFPDALFNIDVKSADSAESVGRSAAAHADRVLLTSFSDRRRERALRAAAASGTPLLPAVSPGATTLARVLLAGRLGMTHAVQRILRPFDAIQIPLRQYGVRVLSPGLIRTAHAVGTEVHVWTVNDVPLAQDLLAQGADGIVTDRADVLRPALTAPPDRDDT